MNMLLLHTAALVTASVAMWVLWACRWRDYRLPKLWGKKNSEAHEENAASAAIHEKACSIIVPSHNQAEYLEKNLPQLLTQDFPVGKYEVIVVDEISTDTTPQVVERLQQEYPHLRYTYVPHSARFVPLRKLAITLGIRAAHSPWVVITLPDCQPSGSKWLATLTNHFSEDIDFVLGYANYTDDGSPYARRAIIERLHQQLSYWQSARCGKATGGDICQLSIRKAHFLQNKGYAHHLHLPLGEGELLVDTLALPHRSICVLSPEATMLQELPTQPLLQNHRVHQCEVKRHLSRRGHWFEMRKTIATCSILFFALSILSGALLSLWQVLSENHYDTRLLMFDIPTIILLSLSIFIPLRLHRTCTQTLGERSFGFYLLHHALWHPLRQYGYRWQRWLSRKEFVRKV